MKKEQVLEIFTQTGVIQKGHFLLTSGRHSDTYMQCAKLFQDAKASELLAKEIAEKYRDEQVDLVIGPAVGGIILAYEVSRQLGCRNIFAERENGTMTLRRGFTIEKGERVLVCEDVVTTGGSVMEVMDIVREMGGEIVGVGVIVDRSAGKVDFGVPMESIISMEVVSYPAEDCPICKTGQPLVKPGSRKMTK